MLASIKPYLKRKWIITGLVVLAVLLYFVFSPGKNSSIQTLKVTRTDFKQQVSISGTVIAAKRVDLGFTQSGRVAHVYVAAGQSVQAGALLADIDNQDLSASIAQRQATLASQQAKLESLKQGTRPEEIALAQADVESDTQALAQANQALLEAMRDAYATADDAVRNRIYQFVSNPRSQSPQLNFSTSDSALQTRFYNEIAALEPQLNSWQDSLAAASSEDATSFVASSQTKLSAVAALLSDAAALINRAVPSASASQATLDSYASSVATGRSSVNSALTGLTSAQTAQKNTVSALDNAKKTLALKQAGPVQADIDAQAAVVAAAQADVQNAQAQLGKTRIVAPFSGIVTDVEAEVGKIVSPNASEVSMISAGVLQIETYIPEVSIVNVQVGQSASVTLDAYGADILFDAAVVAIDPAETVKSGVSTYKTTLQFAAADARIRPGMTANVSITTGVIPQAVAIPQGAIYERDGTHYVQILSDKKSVERAVVLGSNSPVGSVVISSGLSEGDTLILDPVH
jgi:multidrug efflux pump subunit AcrA (membrane-fusion protein)